MSGLTESLESEKYFDVVPDVNWNDHPLLRKILQCSDIENDFVAYVLDESLQVQEFFETVVLQFHFAGNGWQSAGPGVPGPYPLFLFPTLKGRAPDIAWNVPQVMPLIPDARRALIPKSDKPFRHLRSSFKDLTDQELVDAVNDLKVLSSWVDNRGYCLRYFRAEMSSRGISDRDEARSSSISSEWRFALQGKQLYSYLLPGPAD
jgi:hypothetical protein